MNDPLETPDRRPLVYGGVAIVILLVAAFLFWPRNDGVTGLEGTSLTPDTVSTQASADTAPTDPVEPAATTETPMQADTGSRMGTAGLDDLGTEANPRAETRIVEDETPAATETVDESPARTQSTPEPKRTTIPDRSTTQPSDRGEWVLNVGSFGSRANADRRSEELVRQGIAAHVQMGTTSNGDAIYRVRVGYFPSSDDAKRYGEWLKTSQNLDNWASKR